MQTIASYFVAAVLWGVPLASVAQTTTTANFDVTLTVTDSCRVISTAPIAFPTTGVINANVDATGEIAIECTPGTSYEVDLSPGLGAGATTSVRRMTGLTDTSVTVDYAIYQDAARTNIWGEGGAAGDGVGATGSGSSQSYTTFGRVPPTQAVAAQSYKDTVTVTVSY